VIQGVRLLPWFSEAKRRNDLGISDCSKCKTMNTATQRQYMGCGYEPPLDDKRHLTLWHPPSGKVGCHAEPTVCAGYTTSLPEVREVALMHRHWSTGNLEMGLCGAKPTEELMSLIVVLDSEVNAVDVWRMTPSDKGGGAE